MNKLAVFKTPEGKARFIKLYDASLARWPVPYEELNIPTSFGITHIIASGNPDEKPLFLMHGFRGTAIMWRSNVADLSKYYRIYAIDTIGEPNKSEPALPVRNRHEFAQWLLEIFNKLKITKPTFIYQDIRNFGRTTSQANKAIRCWKKNGLITRTGWNSYSILK